MIYYDVSGWQPFQNATNIMPLVGSGFIMFGAINIFQGNTKGGLIQVFMGIGLVVAGFLAR